MHEPTHTHNYREAMFYTAEGTRIRCELCPHFCLLKENETGICHTRIHLGQKLWSLSYGKPVAVHVDPIEKKPLNHFLPGSTSFSLGTAGCNLKCLNCQNWEISTASPLNLRHLDLSPPQVVQMAVQQHCRSVSYTYTDPVAFYEYMLDIALLAREAKLANVMVSAGYINPKPLRKVAPLLDAANIDLKTFDAAMYKRLNKATLPEVLDTLTILKETGVWLEITNLLIPSYTDHPHTVREMCRWLVHHGFDDTPIHFSRFTPMHKLLNLPYTSLPSLNTALAIAQDEGLKHVYIGNVIDHRHAHTYCPNCGHLLIERSGYRTQLHMGNNGLCPKCGMQISGRWS